MIEKWFVCFRVWPHKPPTQVSIPNDDYLWSLYVGMNQRPPIKLL